MTPEQLIKIRTVASCRTKFVSGTPNDAKTLLYGYDCERFTWHTYQDSEGYLHRVIYRFNGELINRIDGSELNADLLVPNKRLYPEACDFEFCQELKALGVYMTFTKHGSISRTPDGPFWGKVFP